MRKSFLERKTNETSVSVELEVDGIGKCEASTGVPFLNHLLELFAKHGLFDLKVSASGDLQVDDHHTVEDAAIVLGQAFKQALDDKRGLRRYGFFLLPMDESLARVAVDLSGRSLCVFKASFGRESIGGLSTENVGHFFEAFARAADCTVHAEVLYGSNDHHKIEALFKAFGRAMRAACEIDGRTADELPTTKGLM